MTHVVVRCMLAQDVANKKHATLAYVNKSDLMMMRRGTAPVTNARERSPMLLSCPIARTKAEKCATVTVKTWTQPLHVRCDIQDILS